jgi:hypothetical protein
VNSHFCKDGVEEEWKRGKWKSEGSDWEERNGRRVKKKEVKERGSDWEQRDAKKTIKKKALMIRCELQLYPWVLIFSKK